MILIQKVEIHHMKNLVFIRTPANYWNVLHLNIKKHLKEEIIRRHRIHFGELVRCDSFDIKLNKKEMNELKKLNDGRYYLHKQREKEIKAINDKYEKKLKIISKKLHKIYKV